MAESEVKEGEIVPEVAKKVDEGKQEREKQMPLVDIGPQGFIGGEIHITADSKTGGMSFSHPANFVVAFGLLEIARSALIQEQMNAQRRASAMQPKLVPGNAEMIKKLTGHA